MRVQEKRQLLVVREHQFLKGAWRLNVEHRARSRARVSPRYTEIGVQCARRQRTCKLGARNNVLLWRGYSSGLAAQL